MSILPNNSMPLNWVGWIQPHNILTPTHDQQPLATYYTNLKEIHSMSCSWLIGQTLLIEYRVESSEQRYLSRAW